MNEAKIFKSKGLISHFYDYNLTYIYDGCKQKMPKNQGFQDFFKEKRFLKMNQKLFLQNVEFDYYILCFL